MADDKTPLPEGTDTIIEGASEPINTGAIATGTTATPDSGDELIIDVSAAKTGGASAGTAASDSGRTASDNKAGSSGASRSGEGVMDKVRSGGEKLSGQAAEKARGLVGQGLERSAEALSSVSRLIGDTANGLDERLGPDYGNYARRAAGAIESTANNLASKNPDELIDDTRDFVRRSPAVALAGAAIVGFAVARLVKSGLSRGDEASGGRSGSRRSADD